MRTWYVALVLCLNISVLFFNIDNSVFLNLFCVLLKYSICLSMSADIDGVGQIHWCLRIIALLVQHIEMLNQILVLYMFLIVTIIRKNYLLKANRQRIENPIYKSRICRMNMHKYTYESDLAWLETTSMYWKAFVILCRMLRDHRKLKRTRNIDTEEMVIIFLKILSHDDKNRMMKCLFTRYGETVSKHFNLLLSSILRLQERLFEIPKSVLDNSSDERWKWFKVTLKILSWFFYF